MDKASLLKIHQQQLTINNTNNDENINELVDILGGINNILTTYLQQPDIILNNKQLTDIHDIIAKPLEYDTLKTMATIYIDDHNKPTTISTVPDIRKVKIALHFKADNNYLSTLFSTKYQSAINKFLHSTWCHILLIASWFMWFAIVLIQFAVKADSYLFWFIYIIFITITLWIPYCIFWILSINKQAGRFIFKSFDFWIKFVYMIQWVTCEMFHRFQLQNNPFKHQILAFWAHFFFYITVLLGVTSISVMDGIHMKKTWIVLMCSIVAVLTIGFSFYHQFNKYEQDDSIVFITDTIQMSLLSRIVNSQRVIGIFLAKQALSAFRNQEKATSINLKPTLKWIEGANINSVNNKVYADKNSANVMANYLDVPDELQTQTATIHEHDSQL